MTPTSRRNSHLQDAQEHLEAAEIILDTMLEAEELENVPDFGRARSALASANVGIGLAQVHATIALAEAFENASRPMIVLNAPNGLSDADVERLREQLDLYGPRA